MQDLISRQAAIDAVIKRDANCGIDSAEVLKLLPSAETERKCGKWIKHETPQNVFSIECSECGCWFLHEHLVRNSFCPNCGAKNQYKWLIVEDHALGEDGNRGTERMIRQERFDTEEEAKIFMGGLRTNGWINRFVAREDEGYKPFKVGDDYC